MGYSAQQLFHVLSHKVEAYNEGRTSFEINFDLLKKGYSLETRFALGKIILNTLGCGIGQTEVNSSSLENERFVNKKHDIKQPPLSFNFNLQQEIVTKSPKMITKLSSIMQDKSKGVFSKHKEVVDISSDPKNKVLYYYYVTFLKKYIKIHIKKKSWFDFDFDIRLFYLVINCRI